MASTATAGLAGYGNVDDTGVEIFTSSQGSCMSFWVMCEADSANNLLVRFLELHGASNWVRLKPGVPFVGRRSTASGSDYITSVFAKAEDASAVANLSWAVAASGKV